MNLHQIAKVILLIEKKGLSKVRFAKVIYFVHKTLAAHGVMNMTDIEYIRMPLGPVPNGYMTLTQDYPDIVAEFMSTGLSYNAANYRLARRQLFPRHRNKLYAQIEEVLKGLHNVTTGDLVEISHNEPSWLGHKNSDKYFITDEDMQMPLPAKSANLMENQNQSLQASLIKGMLEDIVNESTDLEYPTDDKRR